MRQVARPEYSSESGYREEFLLTQSRDCARCFASGVVT